MAKDVAKVFKVIVKALEIAEQTTFDGAAPTFTGTDNIGLADEAVLTVKMTPIADREGGGSELQKGYDAEFTLTGYQVGDISTIEGFKNKNCWIKGTASSTTALHTGSATAQYFHLKNFLANIALDLDFSAKGKNKFMITGKKYVSQISDFFAASAT